MKIFEFDATAVSTGHYDPAQDSMSQRNLDDTRKPILTLADLNRLKRMRAMNKFEKIKRQDVIGVMYASPAEGGPGGFPM